MCVLGRFPSYMCLGIGQVSCCCCCCCCCFLSHPFLCHTHTHTHTSLSLWSFQMITTVVVLYAAKMSKTVQFQDFDRSILLKVSISHFPKRKNPYCSYLFYCILFYKISYAFIFLPDFPSSFAVCWKPFNRAGKHQKTQVWLYVI